MLERCKYTEPRVAFTLAQPERQGEAVRFVEATGQAFGPEASSYRGPVGVLDFNHDGRNSLWVGQEDGFRLLENSNGKFTPLRRRGLPERPTRRIAVAWWAI